MKMIDKDDTEEVPIIPEVTEEIRLSELELQTSENPSPAQEDTRVLSKEEQEEYSKRAKKISDRNNKSRMKILLNGNGSLEEYNGNHVYVWYKMNSNGKLELDHTYPENLKSRLERRAELESREASVKDSDVIYAGKKFEQFAYFGFYTDRQREDLIMLVSKYSLTPDGQREKDNWDECKLEMLKRKVYNEELGDEIEKRREERQRKRKEETNELTERTPLRFSQKQ